ncbi:hypothetical protein HBI56_135380 [Parastagonospora nodorum]|uniref:Uncharacterized protein n=1 Tax=Phaeosphaeria nodorum (strain SN15 / ATCC MYA-4574 / FGSC 10173) TaxID=321614 RepID=A0A7U2F928_PHANO|nr:hypothetical protein HBH56_038480 [Parastagonospora nodorum]QRC99858.1 hypothetical protein JI435_414130 [Parastagonospora nodorum SN15]KAH3933554.1 hypothetical protein HBH54_060980 [Parastagonospora nodorum]KAH3941011.1 hypothetical protein HBH53_207300 [Parastagonospora nodorum]KAH3958065.1 hypothetical protein HBH51_215000 [Parastagonospora nodorum]
MQSFLAHDFIYGQTHCSFIHVLCVISYKNRRRGSCYHIRGPALLYTDPFRTTTTCSRQPKSIYSECENICCSNDG